MSQARVTLCLLLLLPLTARAEEATGPCEITFDSLRFEIKKGEAFDRKMFTPEIEKLVGQRVRIGGYILPGAQARGMEEFILIRDNMATNLGNPPIEDVIIVKMVAGHAVDFTTKKVSLNGVFEIRELKLPDNTTGAVYHLTAESVSRNNMKISTAIQPIPAGAGK